MGLAASQARFLGLTARKSNVEYQGQQINQARMALANEVMNLYASYNKLDVPVPPSTEDYTKTVYSITSADEKYTIDAFTKIPSGEWEGYYNIALSYDEESAKAYPFTAKSAYVTAKKSGDDYTYLSFQISGQNYYYDSTDTKTSTIAKITEDYDKYYGLRTVMDDWGVDSGVFYQIYRNGTYYYTSQTDLNSTAWGDDMTYYGDYTLGYQGTLSTPKSATGVATIEQTSNGRLSTIQFVSADEEVKDLVGYTYTVTATSQKDEDAYQDAMNDYNYKKELYEQEVDRINKKTEKLQTEDKSLELKLAQLDTEQNAISTEMDSVSQVIEDTIESVFKTFS